MMCDLAHCRGEGATCLQFHGGRAKLCFSNAQVPAGKMFDSQPVRVAQTPSLWIKKNDEHGFHSWFAHSSLLLSRWLVSMPLWTQSFAFGIVLENPSFISGYHSLQKFGLTCHTIQEFPRNQHTIVFCSSEKFFGTSFAQMFLMCRSTVMIRWTTVAYVGQTSLP